VPFGLLLALAPRLGRLPFALGMVLRRLVLGLLLLLRDLLRAQLGLLTRLGLAPLDDLLLLLRPLLPVFSLSSFAASAPAFVCSCATFSSCSRFLSAIWPMPCATAALISPPFSCSATIEAASSPAASPTAAPAAAPAPSAPPPSAPPPPSPSPAGTSAVSVSLGTPG
jgi:hypothetical protein